MQPADHWRDVYARKRPDEVSWYQPSPEPSLAALDRLGASPDLSLVDVGGGASTLVDALLDRGWRDLTVLDIAEPALAASKERLGDAARQVQWVVADARAWRPGRAFDVWHDRAVFHFLTGADDRAGYRRAMLEGTHPASHVVMATFAPDGPAMCSGLPVQRYDAGSLAAELGGAFAPLADWRETHRTPRGANQQFQWLVLRRV